MSTTMSVNSNDFATILRCLSILKDASEDITIRNGIIRQRTRDKASVIEMDLTSILGTDISMILSMVKEKIDILKTFLNQDVEIKVDDEDNVYFCDSYSSFRFSRVREDYLTQKFMPESEIPPLNEDNKILTYEIPEIVSNRIRVTTQSFNINRLNIKFQNETCNINAETQSKDKYAEFATNIVTDKTREMNTILNNFPFIIDHDNSINLEVFEVTEGERGICKFTTKIDNCNIVIYCSIFVWNPEESE